MRKCTNCNEKFVTWMVVYRLDFGGNDILSVYDKDALNAKVVARICIDCKTLFNVKIKK